MNFLELLYFFLVLKLQVVKYKVKVCLIALYSAGVADTQRKTFDRAAGRSTNPVSLSSAVVSRGFFFQKRSEKLHASLSVDLPEFISPRAQNRSKVIENASMLHEFRLSVL